MLGLSWNRYQEGGLVVLEEGDEGGVNRFYVCF